MQRFLALQRKKRLHNKKKGFYTENKICSSSRPCGTISKLVVTKNRLFSLYMQTNASSFYRSQNVLGWSKFFVPDQKFIYILCQSQTFCAEQKDNLHAVKLVFVPAQKFLKRH